MSEQELLRGIDEKLSTVIRLLAALLVKDATQKDAILMLRELGLDRAIIAEVCGASAQTVNQRIYEHRKRSKTRRPPQRS
ncbi:MAG: hypothetical protein FJ291_22320 [Planctomycetes bacterium]|nr:hypothetical protein [Planctomycetota bacterium]